MSAPVQQSRGGSDIAIFAGVALAIIGLIYVFSGGERTNRLDRAATGFAGIVTWLKAKDVETLVFRGTGSLSPDRVGLRILPLYDVDLRTDRVPPRSDLEVIAQQSEVDMTQYVFDTKVERLPSLVILPKWRTGMRALQLGHQQLLISPKATGTLMSQIGDKNARVLHDQFGLSTLTYRLDGKGYAVTLFHAQLISDTACDPILGTRRAMLLGRCDGPDGSRFLLLTDPDLMDNHGIRYGDNAALAQAIIARELGGKPAVFDLTTEVYTYRSRPIRESRERSWDEFLRMFAYPFSVIWIAFILMGLLVLWRAATRYGPLARVYQDEPGASKEVSINAKARLLRLSNHDAPLLNTHITARLQTLASELIGAHRPPGVDMLTLLTRLVGRKDEALADELAAASARVASDTPPSELARRLDRFETVYDRIVDEFGRTSGAR